LIHFAQRKFLQARQAFAPRQFGQHVRWLEAEVRQQDHRVEPQVGHLVDDLLRSAVLAGHHGLGGFLAHLLEDGVGALVEEARHIALVRITSGLGLARFDHLRQPGQQVLRCDGAVGLGHFL